MTKYCTSNNKSTRKSKVAKKKNLFNNRKILSFLLIVVSVVSIGFYLFSVNNLSTKGYEIRDLEKQVAELTDTNHKLELQMYQLQSMQNISERVGQENFVENTSIYYLDSSTVFAQR
ncbi:hypothetical protein A2533_04830 [Candidatus Falkowbacteria bacterium RIFOXYD2_FULL_35_9]|uniref:Cell division protein FtsL n=1 Tax=Candidatus Falkowbacteria bacterium RIFOXYC2_FULL_36_12 TaxID=1798002 RepID=A0A1F5SYH3_9BACT|nr:MAG: hypothetical protein A2478_04395 [Candidatus Falkowbacteria bacterium RIFOXYC2_FULL_36_12]OGF33175.1 MAG: hypothetical protein A2223_04900 [Candidatus Falkowbacteria bacterium RIFOXYA2_FULL_35_8]OGF46179.1 MAG: hypothetical protein A2533_04830 [Candidatus Falkowbacteria bacterium RIFOXYD2_FULL_35_9]